MGEILVSTLLWFLAIGCGLMAGLYFAFSSFIMTALDRAGQATGILAMTAINTSITRSLFMPFFVGTTLASVALVIIHPDASLTAACIIYVVGMFLCTITFNVPLNKGLAAIDPNSDAAAAVWRKYVVAWTRWNHVRTGASLIAAGLYVVELIKRG
jgi:uncharacterized membrane protein